MRIAIVSDIHGNFTSLEAILEDLRKTAPDVVFHGGDLAEGGARPVEVLDAIRSLGWQEQRKGQCPVCARARIRAIRTAHDRA
jgi:3',5'-cyclic AMP phosphodiesterase CpdA